MHLLRMGLIVLAVSLVMCGSAVNLLGAEVTWTGNAPNDDRWSIAANWSSDPDLPGVNDDVMHNNSDTIQLDIGTPGAPVVINSFSFDPALGGALNMQSGTGLTVTVNFGGPVLPSAGFYDLTVNLDARLKVEGDMNFINATLLGTDGMQSAVVVDGVIGQGNWNVGPDTGVFVSDGVDASGATPPDGDWTINGTFRAEGPVIGAGTWTVVRTVPTSNGLIVAGDAEFDRLLLSGDAHAKITPGPIPDIELLIGEELLIDDSVLQVEFGSYTADPGSLITLSNGGRLVSFQTTGQPQIGSLSYGLPGTLNNFINSDVGMNFRDSDSTLSKANGISSELDFSMIGDIDIHAKIHDQAAGWDASGVNLFVITLFDSLVPFTTLEMISPDFGGIWFADSPCIKPWGAVDFDCVGSPPPSFPPCYDYVFVDLVDNSNPTVLAATGLPEAMYVDGNVTFEDEFQLHTFRLDLNGHGFYYAGTLGAACPGPEYPNGCPTFVLKTLYGDFDNDCTITPAEGLRLRRIILGVDPYDALFDFDCDGQVTNAVELAQFTFNIGLPPEAFPCYGSGSGGGGFAPLTEEEHLLLAGDVAELLTSPEVAALVDGVLDNAALYAGTPLGDDLVAFAGAMEP